MAHIQLIYGDEPQLIEEEKRKFLSAYPDLPVTVLDDEAGPQKISEKPVSYTHLYIIYLFQQVLALIVFGLKITHL